MTCRGCLFSLLTWIGPILLSGCELDSPSPGGPAGRAGSVAAGPQDQGQAAYRLSQLTAAGRFELAHQLVAEQVARPGSDPVTVLWWRCQNLYVYLREDQPDARAQLARQLLAEPAASQDKFLLSSGWNELYSALLDAGLRVEATTLVIRRHQALSAARDDGPAWRRQMDELAGQADRLGDRELARAIRQQSPAAGPPVGSQPDFLIQPKVTRQTD